MMMGTDEDLLDETVDFDEEEDVFVVPLTLSLEEE